jgi:peptidyl-tRNA hydrolase, PTH1 family
MKLFVGLGNPGSSYARNRHNIGFMACDAIAARHGFGAWQKGFGGVVAAGALEGVKCLLLKPGTYMNESGRAVGEAVRFHKLDITDVIVLHDELDLNPGKLRVKTGGGNAGHNGLRSISALVGNDTVRVRIGIGHPGAKELVQQWVLSDFVRADRDWLEPLLAAIAEAAPLLATDDAPRFMTEVARLTAPAGDTTAETAKGPAAKRPPPAPQQAPQPSGAPRHPAGEGQSKRAGAMAENIRKWLDKRNKSND